MSLLSEIAKAIKTKLGGTSINNTIPRYDGTSCTLKKSDVTISDTNVVTAGGGFVGNLTGTASNATLAASATKLATARTINGIAFDGTANITVADSTKAPLTGTGASGTWGINITGNAATATTATTASNATNLNSVAEDVNATANTIVKRDGNGYINGTFFHSTAGDTTIAASHYYVETGSDGYIRPKPLASVKAEIAGDRAPLASPALTGTPTAPTAAAGTNNTQIATTAFVQTVIASSGNVGGSVTFTASGTWTCPAGVYTAFVRVLGGGGGGGGHPAHNLAGDGGGGGAAVEITSIVKVTPGTTYTIIIGAGGAGSSGNGGNGGNSSALGITGYGGSGGSGGSGNGTVSGSSNGFPGSSSESPYNPLANGKGSLGGCAIWLNVASARAAANVAATLPGQGGGAGVGGGNSATAGKAGFRGQVYICW